MIVKKYRQNQCAYSCLDGVDARQRIREIMLMIRIAVTPLLGKITAVMIEIVKTALLGKFDDNTDCDDGCRRET